MSNQASVHSIQGLKDLRVALALFAEEVLSALGTIDREVRRTSQWLQHDRRPYWQDQIKRRREKVAMAQAEVFRRKLAKTADYTPAYTEQKELLRRAEASLRDAEMRAELVRKWEPALQQALLEFRGATQRIKGQASGDVPRALALLQRLIDALESYARADPPSTSAMFRARPIDSLAEEFLAEEPAESLNRSPERPAKGESEHEESLISDVPG
ncbi:MAG: hypothetical protein NVSMB9_25920 [Isosphaeraceae bacterium]